MNRFITVFYLLTLFVQFSYADCTVDSDVIGAKYKVIVTMADGTGGDIYDLVLWRKGGQALHEYPEEQLADLWEHTPNKQIRLVRHFDEFERAIEYQPGEIKEGRTKGAWNTKRQLIADDQLEKMQLTRTEGEDCDKSVTYVSETENKTAQLEWLTELQLVKAMTETHSDRTIELQLEATMTDPQEVEAALIKRSDFQSTDYADIGDNESDPFLLKMINLGFTGHSHH